MEDVKARKSEIRRSTFARRDALSKDKRSKQSAAIMKRLFGFANFLEARIVLFYMSYSSEVDTEPVVRKALELEKIVALPLVDSKKRKSCLSGLKTLIVTYGQAIGEFASRSHSGVSRFQYNI